MAAVQVESAHPQVAWVAEAVAAGAAQLQTQGLARVGHVIRGRVLARFRWALGDIIHSSIFGHVRPVEMTDLSLTQVAAPAAAALAAAVASVVEAAAVVAAADAVVVAEEAAAYLAAAVSAILPVGLAV